VGITVILAAVAVPNYVNYKQRANLNAETEKVVAFIRNAVSKARSQEDGAVWAIEFKNGDQDYYQLRKGGLEGNPVNTTHLSSGVEFTATTTDILMILAGGPNVRVLPTADSVIELGLQTWDGRLTSSISMDSLGTVIGTDL